MYSYTQQNRYDTRVNKDDSSERSHLIDPTDAESTSSTFFLTKIYAVFLGKSIVLCAIITIFLSPLPYSSIGSISAQVFWPVWVTFLLISAVCMTCLTNKLRQHPSSLLLLCFEAVCSGIILGTLTAYTQSDLILVDVGITGIIFMLMIFQSGCGFCDKAYSLGRSFFGISFLIVIAFGFLCINYTPWDSFYIMVCPSVFFVHFFISKEFMLKDERILIVASEYIFAAVVVGIFPLIWLIG